MNIRKYIRIKETKNKIKSNKNREVSWLRHTNLQIVSTNNLWSYINPGLLYTSQMRAVSN